MKSQEADWQICIFMKKIVHIRVQDMNDFFCFLLFYELFTLLLNGLVSVYTKNTDLTQLFVQKSLVATV